MSDFYDASDQDGLYDDDDWQAHEISLIGGAHRPAKYSSDLLRDNPEGMVYEDDDDDWDDEEREGDDWEDEEGLP